MSNRCSVCSDDAARASVDALLATGHTPADILRTLPEVASRSALYRHAAAHQLHSRVAVQYIGADSTSGDLLADLAGLRTGLLRQYSELTAAGNHAVANRSAATALAATQELLKHGVRDDNDTDAIRSRERVLRAIGRAAQNRPDIATELADAARAISDSSLADDLDTLALKAATL